MRLEFTHTALMLLGFREECLYNQCIWVKLGFGVHLASGWTLKCLPSVPEFPLQVDLALVPGHLLFWLHSMSLAI